MKTLKYLPLVVLCAILGCTNPASQKPQSTMISREDSLKLAFRIEGSIYSQFPRTNNFYVKAYVLSQTNFSVCAFIPEEAGERAYEIACICCGLVTRRLKELHINLDNIELSFALFTPVYGLSGKKRYKQWGMGDYRPAVDYLDWHSFPDFMIVDIDGEP